MITANIKGTEYTINTQGKVGKCFTVLLAKYADRVSSYSNEKTSGHTITLREGWLSNGQNTISNPQLKLALKDLTAAGNGTTERKVRAARKPKSEQQNESPKKQPEVKTIKQPKTKSATSSTFKKGIMYTTANGSEVRCLNVDNEGNTLFRVVAGGHNVEGFNGQTVDESYKTNSKGVNLDAVAFPGIAGLEDLNVEA